MTDVGARLIAAALAVDEHRSQVGHFHVVVLLHGSAMDAVDRELPVAAVDRERGGVIHQSAILGLLDPRGLQLPGKTVVHSPVFVLRGGQRGAASGERRQGQDQIQQG